MFFFDSEKAWDFLQGVDDGELTAVLQETGMAKKIPKECRGSFNRFIRVLGAETSEEVSDVTEEEIINMMLSMNDYLEYLEDGGGLRGRLEKLGKAKSVRRIF